MKFTRSQNIPNNTQFDLRGKNSEYDEFINHETQVGMFNNPLVVNRVTVCIDQGIRELPYYRQFLNYLETMEEHDECLVRLNSPGGYLETATEIIQSINNCKGNVTVIVTGRCHSAAGILALSVPSVIITPNATMLCHAASYGTEGKQHDVHSMVEFSQSHLKGLITTSYAGFLTTEEIEMMLLGKDYWFNSDEIIERLENRQKYMESLEQEDISSDDSVDFPEIHSDNTLKLDTENIKIKR